MVAIAVLAGVSLLAKAMVALALIGWSLDKADRKGGEDARRLRRRATWLGVEEAAWFFGICTLFSVI